MNRKKLISAVQSICQSKGYSFRALDAEAMPAQSPALPAAVMLHPKFESMTGRNHGRITYKMTLYLFERIDKLSPEQRVESIVQMEENMLDIFTQLSDSKDVAQVDSLSIEHTVHSAIGRGECGVKAVAQVEIIF